MNCPKCKERVTSYAPHGKVPAKLHTHYHDEASGDVTAEIICSHCHAAVEVTLTFKEIEAVDTGLTTTIGDVTFNDLNVTLHTFTYGGKTVQAKHYINKTSRDFGLGFSVVQRCGEWFVRNGDKTLPFEYGMTFKRTSTKENTK